MAEMSDYWLYSMNAPFGRTRGGEPDSPHNGFCTVFESRVPVGRSQPRGPVSRQWRARTGCWAEGTAWPRVRQPCRGMTRRWRNRLGAWVRTLVGSRAEGGRQVAVDAGGRRRDVVAWPRGGDRTTGVGGAPIREQRRGCNRVHEIATSRGKRRSCSCCPGAARRGAPSAFQAALSSLSRSVVHFFNA